MLKSGKVILKIIAYDPDRQINEIREAIIDFEEGMTVLAALKMAADDIGLAFRWSCTCRLCTLCTVRVNGRTRLACDTVIEGPGELILEPARDRRVYRDLFTEFTREAREDNG